MKTIFHSIIYVNRYIKSLSTNTRRHVSTTSSSLVTIFNSKPNTRLKLNFKKKSGLFGWDELKTDDGFYLLVENAKFEANSLISETCSSNRKRKVVDIFDDLSDCLCRVADLAEFVRVSHPSPGFAHAAEEACITISGLVERLNTNKQLYDRLRTVCEQGDYIETSPLEKHVAQLFLFDFEQCGIHLAEKERAQVVGLNNYILQLGQRFMSGAHNSRSIPKANLPPNIRNQFATDENQLIVSSLHTDSELEVIREASYRVFLLPDEDQDYLLSEMLNARHELALLCGFPTYAHRALKLSLAEHPNMVRNFLNNISELLKPKAGNDFTMLLEAKKKLDPSCGPLEPWDIPYFSNKIKREWSNIKPKDYMPYFSLGTCMEGLSGLMQSLFGITLVNDNIEDGEVWSPDLYKLAVTDEKEGLLGHIYCDFYERAGKPNQDCHFTIRCGRLLPDGSYQSPVVVVMLNLPSPVWGAPCLLTPSMLENLFHEFGHAMHSMLGRTAHQHVSGTRCPTDFAEVPSILMEYFASDPRVIGRFARHFVTGEPIPTEMVSKLCGTRKLLTASETQLQLFYSALDQELHSVHPLEGTITQVLEKTQNMYYSIPYVPNTAWHLRFSHLVGYGAKYYSYLMSRAVASCIWQHCFSQDPLSRTAGENYRRDVLIYGGSKPVRDLLSNYLKLQVTPSVLASALVQDIEKYD